MREFKRSFEHDARIEKFALEDECESHPSVYMYWAEEQATIRADLDEQKNKLDFVIGETELKLRRDPPDGMKITESTVSALVNTHQDVLAERKALEEIKRDFNTVQAAVQALEHKRAMLDNLRHLTIAGYYARPDGNRRQTGTDDAEDASRKAINKKRKEEE